MFTDQQCSSILPVEEIIQSTVESPHIVACYYIFAVLHILFSFYSSTTYLFQAVMQGAEVKIK